MENHNNTGKLIGAILLGAAIGGIAGVLLAPRKGSETRKNISGQTEDLVDSMKEKFAEFLEGINKEAEIVKNKSSEFMKDGQASKAERIK